MAVIQSRPTHILYQCAKCGDDRTSFNVSHLWRVRRLTCNNWMAYLKNWTDNFFQIFFMGTSWVAVSINNIKTRASREMTSRKNIKIFYFNGVNVAKHWHVAGRGICHLWLPCCNGVEKRCKLCGIVHVIRSQCEFCILYTMWNSKLI